MDQSPDLSPNQQPLLDFGDEKPAKSTREQLSQESGDSSNGFVKLEKPTDLLADLGAAVPPPTTQPEVDITPSDDIAAPVGEDLCDFASSPLAAASDMASSAQQTLEDFLGQQTDNRAPQHDLSPEQAQHFVGAQALPEQLSPSAESGDDILGEIGSDFASRPTPESPGSFSDEHLIDRRGEQEEQTYSREGPLTVGQIESAPSPDEFEFLASEPSAPPTQEFSPSPLEQFSAPPLEEFSAPSAPVEQFSAPPVEQFSAPPPPTLEEFDAPPVHFEQSKQSPIEFEAPKIPEHVMEDLPASVPTVRDPFPPQLIETPPSVDESKPASSTQSDSDETKCTFRLDSIDPRVLDLIYWRDPKKSGVVFAGTLVLLICLATLSLITVMAYTGLAVLGVTLTFRLYKMVMAQVQKTPQANPFQAYLDKDLKLPQDRVHEHVDVMLEHLTCVAKQLRRLFLIEDVVETVKFAVLLWALTYVGSWFSGMTLVILALIGIFTVPKFYEVYKEPIDKHMGVAQGHIKNVTDQVQEKVPFLKKKQQ